MSSKLLTRTGDGRNEIVWDNYDVTRIITPPTFREYDTNNNGDGRFYNLFKKIYDNDSLSIIQLKRTSTPPSSDTFTVRLDDQTVNTPIYAFADPEKSNNRYLVYYCESEKIYLPENSNSLFSRIDNLVDLDITGWDTSKVSDMGSLFYDTSIMDINTELLSKWDTSKVISMNGMFQNTGIKSTDFMNSWDTSNVTDMEDMFNYCYYLESVNLNGINTSNVTNMSYMFYESDDLSSIILSNLDTSKVTDTSYMFRPYLDPGGYNFTITTLDLSTFTVPNLINCSGMFYGCESLTTLLIPNWEGTPDSCSNMFRDCTNLTTIVCTSEVEQWIRNNATIMAIPNIDNITFNRP